MAVLTVQHTASGLSPTWSNASPGGDSYANNGTQTLLVRNQGPTPITVSIPAVTACNQGTLHTQQIQVPANGLTAMLLGPFSFQFYNDASNNVNPSYSTTVQPAPGAPNAAVVSGSGLGVGAYKYQVTWVNASGETTGGTEISVTTTSGNQSVRLDGLPIGPAGVTSRKIYRTVVGGASGAEKLMTSIGDNTTTSFVDTIPDGSLGATIPATNTAAIPAPGAASAAAGAAGNPNGAYKYQVTFVNAGGETTGGVEFTITVTNTQVSLTNIPLGPSGTTSRKVYRTAAAGASGSEKLVATIADNTTTSYTDNIADASLGAAIPTSNTANVIQVALTAA